MERMSMRKGVARLYEAGLKGVRHIVQKRRRADIKSKLIISTL